MILREDAGKDKEDPVSFQDAMETLRDIRQSYQDAERGSRGDSSLPSLRDNRNRRWSRGDPAPSSSCHLPVTPRQRQRTKSEVAASESLPGLLSVTESSQLSQSAPSVMEPLLSSDIMLQARAHIQTRLGCNSAVNVQRFPQGLLSALHPRTPKLLAPLDRRPAPPLLKQTVPLKPISQSPLSSMTRRRRERLSWGSPSTKGGSEESGSSSSQSSMDLEDEDDEDKRLIPETRSEIGDGDELPRRSKDRSNTETGLVEATKLHFSVQSKMGRIPPLLRSTSDLLCAEKVLERGHDKATNINDAENPFIIKSDYAKQDHIEHSVKINIQITLEAKEENHTLKPERESISENTCNILEADEDMKVNEQAHDNAKDARVKTRTAQGKPHQLSSAAHVLKTGPKSKNNRTFSAQVKDKVKVKGAHCGAVTPGKKLIYHLQKTRSNPEKHRAQQHGAKNLAAAGTPRSKSAVDFITYKDMFQQIQSGDEGPAIYEMFAGPVYDNCRVSSTCEKPYRAVQPSLSRKTQQSHKVKHRPLKQPQGRLRRGPRETTAVLPKSKAKSTSSMAAPHVTPLQRNGSNKMDSSPKPETDSVPSKHIELCYANSQQQPEDHVLSTIDEALSKDGSETSDEESPTRPRTHSHIHTEMQSGNSSANLNRAVPQPLLHPNQLMINTWTSSSSDSSNVTSPVYRRFLDEAPLTDDLLQCLAEELISLDEREMSITPFSDTLKSSKENSNREGSGRDEVASADSAARLGSGLDLDDTITWTKGEVLGRGAYGTVYCGLTSQGQLIAVKQVRLDTSDPAAAQREYNRLQEEVELLKALRHTNIVGFQGTSLHQHVVSIFMEYVPGGSIASILHRFGPLPERVLALYTHQIVEGVAYLHLNRVIHRDLKGNNIMLMPTGVIKLIDFGCARRLSCLNHTASSSGDLLKSVHGTPYWMAPEVISETGYGRKSDIWSVGCTVFEMATGKPPLANMDKMAAMFYIGAKKGSMPSLPAGFSENAKDFVKICLTSNQRLRPSAEQLLKHAFISKTETAVKWRKNCCSHPGRC